MLDSESLVMYGQLEGPVSLIVEGDASLEEQLHFLDGRGCVWISLMISGFLKAAERSVLH
jgi:hypothetical protein